MNNLQSARTSWRDKDIDTMLSMKRDGFTDADIGEVLGRSAKAVSVRHSLVMKRYLQNTRIKRYNEASDHAINTKLSDDWVDNGIGPQSHHTVLSDDWVDTIQEPDATPVADDNYVICIPRKAVLVVLVAVLVAASWYAGKYL